MSCSLSTHVLDTSSGKARRRSHGRAAGPDGAVAVAETDGDGRARLADGLAAGTYRLVFHPPSPFFTRVELQVELADGHYHVPLLVSTYGCASYRGS